MGYDREFWPKLKKTSKSDAFARELQAGLEPTLDEACRILKLNDKAIDYIKEPLLQSNYSYLYQRIFHLLELNPELRTNKRGEKLVEALFTCWYLLFYDPTTRAENERKLQEALQILVDFYSMDPKLLQELISSTSSRLNQ